MTRIFYDTEFHEDGSTIDLISIGMVRDDGAEYYAINANADFGRATQNQWLRKNVLAYLPSINDDQFDLIDLGHPDVRPRHIIKREVRRFVLGVENPELWAWYGAYDHVAIAQLFGKMVDLPTGFPMCTFDVRQKAHEMGNPRLPEQYEHQHHALADAHHVKAMYSYLEELS